MLLCFINIKQYSEMSLFDQRIRSVEEPKKCKQRFANTQQLYHVYRLPFNTSVGWVPRICSNRGGNLSCFGFLFLEANPASFS